MQVRPEQLQKSLSGGLKPAYLVSGDEPLQVMEALDAIRAFCREQDFLERDVFDIDKDFDWQRLQESTASLSLFSSRKMIECRLPTGKPGREGSAMLKHYLENPVEDFVLIMACGKLDGGSKNSAWYKALDKVGVCVACWPMQDRQLHGWLQQRFADRGMQVDNDVLRYLHERVEGNMLAAAQEIDKLCLLLGPGTVTMDDVQQAVSDNSRYNMFELVDCALQGDRQRVHKIIDSLMAEGAEPIMVNWALAKDIRLLTAVADQPQVPDSVLMRAGIWKNRLPLFRACLGRHGAGHLRLLLSRCHRIDLMSKGALAGIPWDELRAVSLRLAMRG